MAELFLKKGHLAVASQLQLKPFLYDDLPLSPLAGTITYITDSNTNVIGDVIGGSGTDEVLGIYGTDWTVLGVLT